MKPDLFSDEQKFKWLVKVGLYYIQHLYLDTLDYLTKYLVLLPPARDDMREKRWRMASLSDSATIIYIIHESGNYYLDSSFRFLVFWLIFYITSFITSSCLCQQLQLALPTVQRKSRTSSQLTHWDWGIWGIFTLKMTSIYKYIKKKKKKEIHNQISWLIFTL